MALPRLISTWRSYLLPARRPVTEPPRVIGRGVLPGGIRFVVLHTDEAWPVGTEVELLGGYEQAPAVLPGGGWVAGPMGAGRTRVTLGNGIDARRCLWGRRIDDEHDDDYPTGGG